MNRDRLSYFDGTFVKRVKHVGVVVELGLRTGRRTDLWSHGIRRWKVVFCISSLYRRRSSGNPSNTTDSLQRTSIAIDAVLCRPTIQFTGPYYDRCAPQITTQLSTVCISQQNRTHSLLNCVNFSLAGRTLAMVPIRRITPAK